MKRFIVQCMLGILAASLAAALYACKHTPSVAATHPEAENVQLCGQCHTDGRAAMTHSADFSRRHKFYAYQQEKTCALCHTQSFCSDCHAHKEELKPSDKYKEAVARDMPHRGDYISQHKIDGRLYPASCIKCHGRQNNERCRVCHR